ncbi:MAG: DUF3516 domain-containing protein, partial [Adlercreutzia equolifaciens]
ITHSMVLSVVSRGGDAWANVHTLIADSAQTPEEKIKLNARADEIFATLLEAGVVVRGEDAEGRPSYELTVELPEDFALDQPLSPFLLAALDLLDPESPDYALDVISLVEATLENRHARPVARASADAAMAEMKGRRREYDNAERLAEITTPSPATPAALELYCQGVPPATTSFCRKSARAAVENTSDFKTYTGYGIAKSEGTLCATCPTPACSCARYRPIGWTTGCATSSPGSALRTTDSSLVDA